MKEKLFGKQAVATKPRWYRSGICLLLTSVLTAGLGCDALKKEPPQILAVSPAHQERAGQDTAVSVLFSRSMERSTAENAFSLTGSEGTVQGIFYWNDEDRRMTFQPELPLENGVYYTLRVYRRARTPEGDTLVNDHISSFFSGTDLVPPEVREIDPPDGTEGFPLRGTFRVVFSEPMDRLTVEKNLRLSPPLRGRFEWNADGTEVLFLPLEEMDFHGGYTIMIGSACRDLAGNPLSSDISSFFTAGEEFIRPMVVGISVQSTGEDLMAGNNFGEHHGVNPEEVLFFRFSESVDRSSFARALRFSPTVSWHALWNGDSTQCTLRFSENHLPLQSYEFQLGDELTDRAGNCLNEPVVRYFTVDGEAALPPRISEILFFRTETESVFMNYLSVNELGMETSPDNQYRLDIYFTNDMNRSSVPDNVRIDYISGPRP